MTRRLWFLFALLAALTFCQSVEAQPIPTWKNDAQGRPAPPCMTLDPSTGISTPCPAPAGGAGSAAAGTTIISEGGQSTAFGNTWFTGGPIASSPNVGPGCIFLSDTQVACAGQQAGSATNIRVYQSTDGGVTLPLTFTTGSTPGNLNATGQLVRTAAGPYYMGLVANGAFGNNPLRSVDLNIWTATSGVDIAPFAPTGTSRMAVGGPAGNTVLAFTASSTNRICRLLSPASAFTCVAPAGWGGIGGATAAAYVTGNTWVAIDATAVANVFRSTDDGASWTVAATLTGTKSAIGTANVVCPTSTVCVANVGSSIYRSTDAGLTWSPPVATGSTSLNALLNFGGGNIMAIGSNLSTATPQPGCLPNCQNIAGEAIRTIDNGVTWVAASGPWLAIAGTGGDTHTAIARSNGSAIVTHNRVENGPTNVGRNYGYSTTLPSGVKVLNRGEIPTIPIQGGTLLNSSTVSAANAVNTVTLTGIAGFRFHIYKVDAFCSAGTATLTITEGATIIHRGAPGGVGTTDYREIFTPGLTLNDGVNAVISVTSCGVGNTSTLNIVADQF